MPEPEPIPRHVTALSAQIVDAAIKVHMALGPGLLESAYRRCLCKELQLRGIGYRTEVHIRLSYEGIEVDGGYKIDILVEDCIVLELKVVEYLHPVHEAQLLTYLKLSGCRVGLLLNFHVPLMKNGIKRMVL